MKALTLWAPHGVLVPFGWKEVETRAWYTSYRGPLAIHVAKAFKPEHAAETARMAEITGNLEFCGMYDDEILRKQKMLADTWPASVRPMLGCIVAVFQLAACLPASFAEESSRKLKPPFVPRLGWSVEKLMGNYEPGRWAWILRDGVRLTKPVPARGARKLWELDDKLLRAQLP